MEVKEYQLGNRIIRYYSIFDLRKEFQKYIKDNNFIYDLNFEIITSNTMRDFIKGTLKIYKLNGEINNIVTSLIAIDECFNTKDKISNEFVKLQTRLEKRLYMILLGLTDPDELVEEEENIKENIEREIKEDKITEAQLKVILGYIANIKYKNAILNFLKEKYQKTEAEKLTKHEAVEVIQFINELIKKG